MQVFLNGEIINEEEAKISISDLSYQFGYGLFETIRCEEGIPLFFDAHFKRLTQSSKGIGMPFPIEELEVKSWITDLLKTNKLLNARVKIIISQRAGDKFNVSIFSSPLEKSPESYSLIAYKLGRDPNSVSFKHKTTSRADSYMAYKEALELRFNDALYINEKNELIECTRANIFLVLEDRIITPLLECGILSGVTRSKIIEIAKKEGITVEEKNVNNLYLNKAKSVFITNAIIGIMKVSKIRLPEKEHIFSQDSKITLLKNLYDAEIKKWLKGGLVIQ